jgi:hypothetical protein
MILMHRVGRRRHHREATCPNRGAATTYRLSPYTVPGGTRCSGSPDASRPMPSPSVFHVRNGRRG